MSFEFDSVDRFVAGTIGLPGEREFYIQARSNSRLVSVALEKLQVGALAERLEIVVNDVKKGDFALRVPTLARDDDPLETPIEAEFEVGAISIAWDQARELMTIELFEIAVSDDDAPSCLRVHIDLSMCEAFVKRSKALVNSGRLPCPFCGMPINTGGHLCPRANGYRR